MVNLIFPNWDVLLELPTHLTHKCRADPLGNTLIAKHLDPKGKAHIDVFFVDGCNRVDQECLDNAGKADVGKPKSIRCGLI